MQRISPERLRALRNDLPVDRLLARLAVPLGRRGQRTTFRCPVCSTYRTTTNLRANLVYCHRCRRSLNPIDLAMAISGWSFLQAVLHLQLLLEHERLHADRYGRGSCGPPPSSLRAKPRGRNADAESTPRSPGGSD